MSTDIAGDIITLLRFVLDTGVIVAALRSDRGASRQLLAGALVRRFTLLLSVPLMMEYEAVATRPEHLDAAGLSVTEVDDILSAIAAVAEPVRLAFLWRPMLPDPGDEMVLETAVNGRAHLLVTLNRRHLEEASRRFGIRVVSPGTAWRRLEGTDAKE